MELTGLFPIIRRWLVVILVATAMATVVGVALGLSAEETYEARAQLLVGPLNTDGDTMRASGELAQTYAQLATSDSVLSRVAEDLDVPHRELSSGVRATANSTTRFLVVRARSHDREGSAEVANAVALQLVDQSKRDGTRPEGQLWVIDPAGAPAAPVSPRLDLIVPLAAVAGLLGSLTLVLLFEFVGDTAESAEAVDALTHVPTLTVRHRRTVAGSGATDPRRSEPFRVVVTQADLAAHPVRCVLLTGVANRDGTGALALALADVWGTRRPRVTLIDAGAGEVSAITGREGLDGLTEALDDHLHRPGLRRRSATVDVLGSGRGTEHENIRLADAQRLITDLAGRDGLVLVHAPSPTTSAATLVWAQAADVTVLVVRRFQARRSAIGDAAVNLRTVKANLAFSVLHDAPRPASGRRFLRAGDDHGGAAPIDDAVTTPAPAPTPTPGLAGPTGPERSGASAPRRGADDAPVGTGPGRRR